MSISRVIFDRVWMKFHRGETHDSLRDLIPSLVRNMVGRAPDPSTLGGGDFWAVQDLSFDVLPGQVLGIIGSNGSGKSTTLRILTKILEQTRGRISITGRIGALIEVSAGFHGDLTGRENVFLQGAIMGMSSKDIARKFDEIVEFSGVSAFIDTPVKRYSSGMNARLGFSIAAHLDPDVLVIDEVLAVGDFLFQERAFSRISQLGKSGIPVVIVSHQLDRVAELCTHAILLERGVVAARGSATDCIAAYVQQRAQADNNGAGQSNPNSIIQFHSVSLPEGDHATSGGWINVRVQGHLNKGIADSVEPVLVRVRSLLSGQILFVTGVRKLSVPFPESGPFTLNIRLQANIPAGGYMIEACAYDSAAQQEILWAPSVMIRVSDPIGFAGTVQFNPQMQVEAV